MESAGPLGHPETWPGHLRLKRRLESLVRLAGLGEHPQLVVHLGLTRAIPSTLTRIGATAPRLTVPSSGTEFDHAGHCIRLTFDAIPQSRPALEDLFPDHLHAYPLGYLAIRVHADVGDPMLAGDSNPLLCMFEAIHQNPGHPEFAHQLTVQRVGEGAYELGIDAHGDVCDAFLIRDDIIEAGRDDLA